MKSFLTSNRKKPVKKLRTFAGAETFGAGEAVFQIDFLRRRFLPRSIRVLLAWIVLGGLTLQVLAFSFFAVQSIYGRVKNHQLKSQNTQSLGAMSRDQLIPSMDSLHQNVMHRLMDLRALVNLQNERFMTAGKLAGITRTLPARTWVTEININRKQKTLVIHGAFLIDPRNPYEISVSGWMDALKQDPQFSEGLTRIEMIEASNSTREKAELYLFQILGEWAPEAEA